MNVFVTENPRVRVFIEQSTGRAILATNNVHPSMVVELVSVPDGKAVVTVEDTLPVALDLPALIENK